MAKLTDDSTGWDTLPQGDIRKIEPRAEVLIERARQCFEKADVAIANGFRASGQAYYLEALQILMRAAALAKNVEG